MNNTSPQPGPFDCILMSVGNTRTALALGIGNQIGAVVRIDHAHPEAVTNQIQAWLAASDGSWQALSREFGGGDPEAPVGPMIVTASVNEPAYGKLLAEIRNRLPEVCIRRAGVDMDIPLGTCLRPDASPGQDRLLNAVAAYDILKQACIVVDAGTAVTVDFVDGEGTFHGGAIAPGARMQLDALSSGTAALPRIELTAPDDETFGGNTIQSMLQGVFFGIRGLVRQLAERYAEAYGAYPIIVATGGDAPLLFAGDELIDRVVDDLTLRGLLATLRFDWDAGENESGPGRGMLKSGEVADEAAADAAMIVDLRWGNVRDDDSCDCGHDQTPHSHHQPQNRKLKAPESELAVQRIKSQHE